MAKELKFGIVNARGIPEDEPIFILRAQDRAALQTLTMYEQACLGLSCDREHIEGVRAVRKMFANWQAENPTKVPD